MPAYILVENNFREYLVSDFVVEKSSNNKKSEKQSNGNVLLNFTNVQREALLEEQL